MSIRKFTDSTDVSHAVAACGSRTLSKAEEFIHNYCPKGAVGQQDGLVGFKPKACGSYKEVVEDPVRRNGRKWRGAEAQNVHIVYIGTPHPSHYEDVMLALNAGKHCLVEKASWQCGIERTALAHQTAGHPQRG